MFRGSSARLQLCEALSWNSRQLIKILTLAPAYRQRTKLIPQSKMQRQPFTNRKHRRPRWKVLLFFFIWIMEWRKPSNPLTHSSSKMMETFLHLIMSHKPTTWANNNYILESNQPSVRRPYNHEFMHSHTGVTIFIISVRQFQLVSRFLFSRHILMSKKLRVFGARFWSYTRTILLKKRSCCVIANLSDISPYASFDCVHVTHNFYLFLSFV